MALDKQASHKKNRLSSMNSQYKLEKKTEHIRAQS